jgi:hypothetical protein
MHDSDMDAWRAIDHGERPIDWAAFIGHPDGADYLTQAGKDLMSQAAGDLTDFFGPSWLDRAMQPHGPRGPRIPQLSVASPVLALAPARRAGAYIETIRWWASLQILISESVPGHQAVRRDTHNNITAHRLLHTLTQARLAAIGLYQGAHVAVEPGKAGGPGDVLWNSPHGQVFIEIATFGPDPAREQEETQHHRHWMHLLALTDGPIWWEGYIPGFLNKADEARWLQVTAVAAARCRETGQVTEVPGPNGTSLCARPGRQPAGTGTFGHPLDLDFSARLDRILDEKGAQTQDAGVAWIWIEDYGGTHPLHPFASLPLSEKIPALARLASPALAGRPHVAGIAWSCAAQHRDHSPDEQAESNHGLAIRRALPVEHHRQTVIAYRQLILPGQARVLAQACQDEPHWLDWTLRRLGINGGTASLLRQHPPTRKTTLWTPDQHGP